ncbi:MAG: FHA domain-containing protein [Candidatus Competibacter denitrificans]
MKFKLWPFSRQQRESPEVAPVRARFIRTDSIGKGDLRLRSALCRIGRAPDNDICFDNDSVSGRHAEIYYLPDGSFQICDVSSTNGTWVNGQRIQSQLLKNGDVVELGEIRLHFRVGD